MRGECDGKVLDIEGKMVEFELFEEGALDFFDHVHTKVGILVGVVI